MKLTADSKDENHQKGENFSPDADLEGAFLVVRVGLRADYVYVKDANQGAKGGSTKERTAAQSDWGNGLIEEGNVEASRNANDDIDNNVADCHHLTCGQFLRVDMVLVWHALDKPNCAA